MKTFNEWKEENENKLGFDPELLANIAYNDGIRAAKQELRDHFAGLAMQGAISDGALNIEGTATWAYQIADAMLAEREKGETK